MIKEMDMVKNFMEGEKYNSKRNIKLEKEIEKLKNILEMVI